MSNHFIIMADVIGSRERDGNSVMAQLSAATKAINVKFMYDILSPLTITLGDEYQGVVSDLPAALWVIFRMEEMLIEQGAGFKLKHVVWRGGIDTGINPLSAHGMVGSGLAAARRKLGDLKKSGQRFFVHTGDPDMDALILPALNLYRFFVDDWSQKDYPLVSSFLAWGDYKVVAADLGKDVSLMWRRERSLHISEYLDIKKILILLSQS